MLMPQGPLQEIWKMPLPEPITVNAVADILFQSEEGREISGIILVLLAMVKTRYKYILI